MRNFSLLFGLVFLQPLQVSWFIPPVLQITMERLSNLFFCEFVFWNPHSSVKILRTLHLHIFHNTPALLPRPLPPIFCISIVFNFYWDTCNTQEKLKAKVMQYLGATRCLLEDMQMENDKDSVIRLFSWKNFNVLV